MATITGTVKCNAFVDSPIDGQMIRVYAPANHFADGHDNGVLSVSKYQFWSFLGAVTKINFIPGGLALLESTGDYTDGDTPAVSVSAKVLVDGAGQKVGYRIYQGDAVLHESGAFGGEIDTLTPRYNFGVKVSPPTLSSVTITT